MALARRSGPADDSGAGKNTWLMTGHDMTSEEMIDSGGRGQPRSVTPFQESTANTESKEASARAFFSSQALRCCYCCGGQAQHDDDAATSVDLRPVKGSRKRGPACPACPPGSTTAIFLSPAVPFSVAL